MDAYVDPAVNHHRGRIDIERRKNAVMGGALDLGGPLRDVARVQRWRPACTASAKGLQSSGIEIMRGIKGILRLQIQHLGWYRLCPQPSSITLASPAEIPRKCSQS